MRRPQLRSPFARAVVPVLAGIGFFALFGLALWGVAALMSDSEASQDFSGDFQEMGRTDAFADAIAVNGPIILPDLIGDDRHIVLDHTGADPQFGWAIYAAYPADRDPTCIIEQIESTRQFIDCEGRTIEVEDLAQPPAGVAPIVGDDHLLTLDLRADTTGTSGS